MTPTPYWIRNFRSGHPNRQQPLFAESRAASRAIAAALVLAIGVVTWLLGTGQ
jgi:hypothetical protein